MNVIWSPLAIEKVTEIAEYIADDNPVAAGKWVDNVFKKVKILSDFPQSGREVPELKNPDYQEIIYGNYRVIYKVDHEVKILTVRHGMQLLDESDLGL